MREDNGFATEDQNDLVALLLKRQAELNALLEITQAINRNVAGSVLIEMLELIVKNNLKVGRFRLLVKIEDTFICVSQFGGNPEEIEDYTAISQELIELINPTELSDHPDPLLNGYNYFIPVFHKNSSLAYVLVGEFEKGEQMLGNKVDYIQTLINVIVVAFENKKLFRERIQKERLQRELELASEVQTALIPQVLPKNQELDVEAIYLPHQNIGGDLFDFIELNEDELIWCIADVSGKGISAALIMASFQASLRALVSLNLPLLELVERLNNVIFESTKGDRFLTLFIAKYNKLTRQLNYINAGHNASLLVNKDKVTPLITGTTLLGVFDELPFINEGIVTVDKEATIFNYTDGVLEFDGDEAKSLSEEDLIDFLDKNKGLSLSAIHKELIRTVEGLRNSKPATDDITILSLRFY